MNAKQIMKIFEETAYVRMGGSTEELRCAKYIQNWCETMGKTAAIEPFKVDMATMKQAQLLCDGISIPCKG